MKLQDFSLLKEDQHSYTIGHPQGKSIVVSKSGMSSQAQALVSKLRREQHFANGGELTVESLPDETPPESPDAPETVIDFKNPTPVQQPQQPIDIDLNTPPPTTMTPQAAEMTPQPMIPASPQDAPMDAFKTAEADIQAGVKAEQTSGEAQALAQGNAAKAAQDAQKAFETRAQTYDAQALKLSDNIRDKKIDPDRYWHSLKTGSKITSALGMIISGIGAGLTHSPNLAIEMLNKAIDNDIDSQKNDQSKNMTLWKMNREALGDDRAATLASQSQYYAIAHAKALQAQAAAQGPLAKQRMAPVLLGIEQQEQAVNRQRAMLDLANHPSGGEGGLSSVDPAVLVPSLVPKEHQQRVFDQIKAAQDTKRMSGAILAAFEKAAQENTVLKTGAGVLRTPASVYALHQALQPTFVDLEHTVRQGAMDNTFKNTTPTAGDFKSSIDEKRKTLQDYLKSKASAPTAKGYGIDLNKFQSTSSGGASGYVPGSIVSVKGKNYRVAQDGDTLEAL